MSNGPIEPSPRAAALDEVVGTTVGGKYKIAALLGRGGMGAVYEAENVAIGKRVAIKFVDREYAKDEEVATRFAREARAASSIESAHIVTVFDAGIEDGSPYLVMELLRGEDVGARLRAKRTLPLAEALHVVAQVLVGLARAHDVGIIHRDLKPDNVILVARDGDPLFAKIVDFGISKIQRAANGTAPLALTARGTVLGTPFYMSPEQAQAAPDLDARADLYSVGAILFECLTGRPPHVGSSYEQVIVSICMQDAPDSRSFDPSIPDEVAAFLKKALERDRAARFESAAHMLAALLAIAPAERIKAALDVVPPTLKPGEVLEVRAGARASIPNAEAYAPTLRDPAPRMSDPAWASTPPRDGAANGGTLSRKTRRFGLAALAVLATLLGAGAIGWMTSFVHSSDAPSVIGGTAKAPSSVSAMTNAAPAPIVSAPVPPALNSAKPIAATTPSATPPVSKSMRPSKPALEHPAPMPAAATAPAHAREVSSAPQLDLARDLP